MGAVGVRLGLDALAHPSRRYCDPASLFFLFVGVVPRLSVTPLIKLSPSFITQVICRFHLVKDIRDDFG